jgi:hypothetical protein
MNTIDAIRNAPRQARPVTLPGGVEVHVRSLTLGELRRLEEDNTRAALTVCALALVEEDGTRCIEDTSPASLQWIEDRLTIEQIEAVGRAAVPRKDDAKNA